MSPRGVHAQVAAAPFKIRLMAPRSCCHYLPHLAASVAATSFLDQERGRGPIGCCLATVRAHPQGTLSENDCILVWEKWLRDSEGRRATPPVCQVAVRAPSRARAPFLADEVSEESKSSPSFCPAARAPSRAAPSVSSFLGPLTILGSFQCWMLGDNL